MGADVAAVILAAGFSRRMTAFKPLADLAGVSSLAHCVRLFSEVGVRRIVTVCGHRAEEVSAEAVRLGAQAVLNPDFTQGMFTSIRAGAASLGPEVAGFFLLPVDICLVRPHTIRRLLESFRSAGPDVVRPDITYPSFRGERGHPPLLSADLIPDILAAPPQANLRQILNAPASDRLRRALDVPVPDSAILADMDTDADLAAARTRAARPDLPTREECSAMLECVGAPDRVSSHGRAVARLAVLLGQAVNAPRNGRSCVQPLIDLDLADRAALVHDIAKGHPQHEAEGARLLTDFGYPDMAAIVAAHRDLVQAPGVPLTARELVYLADKFMFGSEAVPAERRFGMVLEHHGHDPEAHAAITRRLRNAQALAAEIKRLTGLSVYSLAQTASQDHSE